MLQVRRSCYCKFGPQGQKASGSRGPTESRRPWYISRRFLAEWEIVALRRDQQFKEGGL